MQDFPNRFIANFLKLLLSTLLITGLSGCKEDPREDDNKESVISTFYLIRHAEKDRVDSTNLDPELSQKGLDRAIRWAEVFDKVKLDAIYSTNYERTTMTAAPTSVKKDIDIQFYDPETLDIEGFKIRNEGMDVLIVGHSNTTPVFANQLLGEEEYEQMDDEDNSSLFIVRIIDNRPTAIRLNMD